MQQLLDAEKRVRAMVRERAAKMNHSEADIIAGDVAAQVYHYLRAVAHSELAIIRAAEDIR